MLIPLYFCCQSNHFATAFPKNWKNGKYIFTKHNIPSHIFENILRYLYCGRINLSAINGPDVLKLLIATDELGLNPLSKYIQEFFTNNQKEFLRNDPIGILEVVFQHEAFTTLKDYCLKTICQEPGILFGTDKILALPAQILELLLKREDLELNEIEVWNNLIRWAYAQQSTVNKDPYEWMTKDENEDELFEKTLLRFIPLIRFNDITSEEYYNMIVPYDDLFSANLRNEIKFHFVSGMGSLPSRSSNTSEIDSVIVNAKHLAIFASWISKNDVILKQIQYKFNLILRGSKDGFNASSFHKKCNNKGETIVVAKIKGTNQIVGGYNPLDWVGNCIKNTPDSFIFTFENYKNLNTGRISRVIEAKYAAQCYKYFGPMFGALRRGNSKDYRKGRINGHSKGCSGDIMVTAGGIWNSIPNSYPNLNIPRNFEIDNYEVFQVIKKN